MLLRHVLLAPLLLTLPPALPVQVWVAGPQAPRSCPAAGGAPRPCVVLSLQGGHHQGEVGEPQVLGWYHGLPLLLQVSLTAPDWLVVRPRQPQVVVCPPWHAPSQRPGLTTAP